MKKKREVKEAFRKYYAEAEDMFDEKFRPEVKEKREKAAEEARAREAVKAEWEQKVGFEKAFSKRQMQSYRSYRVDEPKLKASLL